MEPDIAPELISRLEDALADFEHALQSLNAAIAGVDAALVQRYGPDSDEWFPALEQGRLGAVFDRIERLNIEDIGRLIR